MKYILMVVVIVAAQLILTVNAASFTYTDNISIPDNQLCDNWGSVSYYTPAYIPVIQSGESRKIILSVPNNSERGFISFKGHASKPSQLMTEANYPNVFYIEPRWGSHVSTSFSNPVNYLYVYHNAINNDVNLGPSTMTDFTVSFKLTESECNKRGNIEPPKVVVPDLKVKPIILRGDFSFNLNQLQLSSDIFAVQFEYSHNENGSFYFKTTSVRLVTVDDYDRDGYTVLSGDCNDDNADINPNEYNCN